MTSNSSAVKKPNRNTDRWITSKMLSPHDRAARVAIALLTSAYNDRLGIVVRPGPEVGPVAKSTDKSRAKGLASAAFPFGPLISWPT